MAKAFKGYKHGTGVVDLRHLGVAVELRPTEIHLKDNGSLDNGPSLTIVLSDMKTVAPVRVIGQISIEMLNEGLADIGYKIVKNG